MAFVTLERFSVNPVKAASQARDLRDWTTRNPWLADTYYSGSPKRYGRDLLRGTRNVLRLATADGYDAFIVRPGPEAPVRLAVLGLATVIGGQTIELPGSGQQYHGPDIDYVLDARAVEAAPELHRFTALGSIARVGQLYPGAAPFAVLTDPSGTHDPVGYAQFMDYRGMTGPEGLTVPGADPYDIAKGGQPVHVYTLGVGLSGEQAGTAE
jgi:hypothetical protein